MTRAPPMRPSKELTAINTAPNVPLVQDAWVFTLEDTAVD